MSYICGTQSVKRKLHILCSWKQKRYANRQCRSSSDYLPDLVEQRKWWDQSGKIGLQDMTHFFNTRTGEAYMRSVGQALSDPKRGHVDRIERVTLALEEIAGVINIRI